MIILITSESFIIVIMSFSYRYYENGATALFPDFFNPEILDKFAVEANNTVNIVTQQRQLDVELWLGETSSCYGGGAPGLSDTYLAGFM